MIPCAGDAMLLTSTITATAAGMAAMVRTGIARRWRLALLVGLVGLATAGLALAEPANPPAMTPAQFDQVAKLCQLRKTTTLEPPAKPGGEPIISERHCDPDWDARMKCAEENFGKAGKVARTSFTSEWICQIAAPPSANM